MLIGNMMERTKPLFFVLVFGHAIGKTLLLVLLYYQLGTYIPAMLLQCIDSDNTFSKGCKVVTK